MAKHVKFYSGHTVKEWETKYKKQIAKGKIKVFNNEKDLIDFAYYWKIDGKYYQVPNIFEWYNKSLRKSVGLTVALTGTSILATFFLVAALIQSQVKWNDNQGYTVSLYANEGKFDDGTKSKTITGVKKGTKLKNIRDYQKKYIPNRASEGMEDYEFGNWYVDDGKDAIVFDEESEIIDNIALKANYEMVPSKETTTFKNDSWATVYHVIEQGADVFIDTYCKDYFNGSNNPNDALMNFMNSADNWKTLSIGNVGDYGVRIIGVGQDKLAEGEEEIDRELFTFEFNECIQQVSYSYEQGGAPFYTASGAEDPEYTLDHDYCYLKTYYDSDLLPQFPEFLQKRIKTVEKKTLEIDGGFMYHSTKDKTKATEIEQKYDSWVFDREDCINNLKMAVTNEKLFSLSIDEIGGDYIEFSVSSDVAKQWDELTGDTTQATFTGGATAVGEGFERDIENGEKDYRGAYMFYQNEWTEEEIKDRTYTYKREKQCFIGDDEKGIEAPYRLRSIYIPYEYDKDYYAEDVTKGILGGNKDYRCFETFNVNGDGKGCIGNVKHSDLPSEENENARYDFLCGDMAWAGIYVAPAFCL